MSTYLSRPVFETEARWHSLPSGGLEYSLRERGAGFGRPGADQEQLHPRETLDIEVQLDDAAACHAFEEFLLSVKGRLTGFWLPSPDVPFTIAEVISGSVIEIADMQLDSLFADLPQLHLWFTHPRHASVGVQVNTVTDVGGGRERLQLGSTIANLDAEWTIQRLLYVRHSGDEFRGRWVKPNLRRQRLRMVELPTEYATAETGLQPISLFHFWIVYPTTTLHWRFTSFPADIVSNGETFLARPIDYRGVSQDVRAGTEEAEIVTEFDSSPLAQFFPFTSSRPVQCEILEAAYATPDTTAVLASGFLVKPKRNGRQCIARVASFADFLGSKIPSNVIGPRCGLQWGHATTCKVTTSSYRTIRDIKTIEGNVITLDGGGSGSFAAGRFATGWIQVGTGSDFEVRDILASNDDGADLQLTLNAPLVHAVVTDSLTAYYGCQRTRADCNDTFANLANYGGCPSVPSTNLSVPSLSINNTNGNKK